MKSKRDPNHIIQHEHDELSGAKKVKLIDTEMSIELDADDGDSVRCQSRCESIVMVPGQEIDISKYSRAKMYVLVQSASVKSQITLEISPEPTGTFFRPTSMYLTPTSIVGDSMESSEMSVMGMRARILADYGDKVILVVKGI